MQHPSFQNPIVFRFLLTLAAFSIMASGCASGPPTTSTPLARGNGGVWNDPTAPARKQQEAGGLDAVREASQDQAQRLAKALTQRPSIDAPTLIHPPKVRWLKNTRTLAPDTIAHTQASNTPKRVTIKKQQPVKPSQVGQNTSKSFAQQWSGPDVLDSRRSLIRQLRKSIRNSQDPKSDKVLAAIGLSLTDPDQRLKDADLELLAPEKRQQYRRYQKILVTLAQQLVSEDDTLDRNTIVDQIDEAMGDRPIQITKVDLCQRVRGFGVYDPFDSHVFLTGRDQPMIVYAEVANFSTLKTDANRHQVKLAQEVVLYNESDGLAVWRQPTVDIIDQSRNRRHDFFVVQMIRLPARLTVGKYLLKVRITDTGSETLDESTIPIQFVADQSLVNK